MAQPLDSAFTLLSSASAVVRQRYADGYFEQSFRYGKGINKILSLSEIVVQGDGLNVQVETGLQYNAQVGRNFQGAWPNPTGFTTDNLKIRFSETIGSNDFTDIKSSARVTVAELERLRGGVPEIAAVDIAKRTLDQLRDDFSETVALMRQLPQTAQVGVVSTAAPRANTATLFASCPVGTPAANQGARFQVTGAVGSFAFFQINRRFDVYSSGGVYKSTLQVTDTNPADLSVGVVAVDANGVAQPATAIGTTLLNSNDLIYYSGAFNAGMLSFGAWFSTPVAGENFYGRDRTQASNRWLLPTTVGPSTTSVFSKQYLDDLDIALQYVMESPDQAYVALMQPELQRAFINEVGEQSIIQYPVAEQSGALAAQYGFDGKPIYRSPQLGRIILDSNPLAAPRCIRFARLGDWKMATFFPEGMKMYPGESSTGYFRRLPAPAPNSGFSTVFQADGHASVVDYCLRPRAQGQITNITA